MESKILQLAELFVFAEIIENKGTSDSWMWAPNDIISREILKHEGGWVNICPKTWSALGLLGFGLSRVYRTILSGDRTTPKTSASIQNKTKWSKYQIIYFPHIGINYSHLFKKDHFYSSKTESPFSPSKILHFSLSEDPKLIKSSIDYYNENDIPYADWSEVSSVTKKQMILMSFSLLKYLTKAWKRFDLYLLVYILM